MALPVDDSMPRNLQFVGKTVKGVTDKTSMTRHTSQPCDLTIRCDFALGDMIYDFVYARINYTFAHEPFAYDVSTAFVTGCF